MAKLIVYDSESFYSKDRYRWRLVSSNGKIICASSEGFKTKRGAQRNARLTFVRLGDALERGRQK